MTGEIVSLGIDYETRKPTVTIRLNGSTFQELEMIKNLGLLDVELKKHCERRSKDANALFWACVGEMAAVLHADKWDVYLRLLRRYGQYTYICVKPSVVESVKKQWREVEEIGHVNINGADAVQLLCYFGSSTYDSKEFSRLLEGTISEMAEMGLRTPGQDEIERLIEAYGKKD